MAQRPNYPKVVTPKGTAIWPRLNTPDTKYNKAGVYEVKLAFEEGDAGLAPLQEKVQGLLDAKYDEIVEEQTQKLTEAGKKGLIKKFVDSLEKVSPFKAEEDPETGDETGRVIVKAKMTASGISAKTGKPWTRKPNIFDAKGHQLKNPPQIGGGTEMKLSVELLPYYAANDKTIGVSFRLEAAQIIKLVQFGARDAAGYGFGEEDGDDLSEAEQEFGAVVDSAASGEEDEL